MRTPLAFLLLTVLSFGFAPAPFPKPAKPQDDPKMIEGVWHRLTCTRGAIPAVPSSVNDFVLIRAGKIHYSTNRAGVGGAPWNLTLGKAGNLRTFDITNGGGRWLGLYELKGDDLRVCFTPAGNGRPASIEPQRKGEHLQVFKRVKP